jgi:hypothetical protein
LPVESDNVATLLQRLRFETFRSQLVAMIAVDDEIILPPEWGRNLERGAMIGMMQGGGSLDSVTNIIALKLGLAGEKEWKIAAFRVVMQSLAARMQREMFDALDLDAEIAVIVKDIEDETQRAEMAAKIKVASDRWLVAGETASGNEAQRSDRISGATVADGFPDDNARFDWLVATLLEAANDDPRQLSQRINHYANVISQLPEVYRMLEYRSRDADIAKLDAMIDRLAEQEPQFYMLRIRIGQQPKLKTAMRLQCLGLLSQTRGILE